MLREGSRAKKLLEGGLLEEDLLEKDLLEEDLLERNETIFFERNETTNIS
jgi:hypothetical protein